MGTCGVYRDNTGFIDSCDFIRTKGNCGAGRGNIVVKATKVYIQLQIGPNSNILVAGVGNPIVKFSRGS